MKKVLKPVLFAVCMATFLSAVIYSCKRPTEGLDIIIKTDALSKSPTLLSYTNANPTGTAIPASMAVTVSDPKGVVQTDDGGKVFTAYGGLLSLSLSRFATPSASAPVKFTVSAAPKGFIPVINTFSIVSDTAVSNIIIPLIEYAHPPKGTAALTKTTTLTSNAAPLTTLTTTPATATTEACTITIPAGTQFKDANGAVISASTVTSNIVYLGTTAQDAYNAFPGGFNPKNVVGPDGKAIVGGATFITGGFVSINMLANNTTAVKGFSKPITVNMEINSALINPETGVKVRVGDVFPVWSLDEQTGTWKYESSATVVKNADGNLAVNLSVTHLTGWSIDWYGTACGSQLSVTVNIPGFTNSVDGYEVFLASANEQYLGGFFANDSWSNTVALFNNFKAIMANLPSGLGNVKLVVYSRKGDPTSKVAESSLFAPCGKGSISISLPAPILPDNINAHINVVANCSSKQVVAYPTTWLALKDVTDAANITSTNVHMVDGVIDVKLVSGHTYSMGTSYNGKNFTSGAFKVDRSTNITIPSGSGLSGTAVYNATTKVLTINARFILSKCG